MEPNVEEALRAKSYAEKRFSERDFASARSYALKAQMLCPNLDGISQMVATFEVYTASEVKINGEFDFYGILGLEPSADKAKVKKQYKKMAVLLHPDKNKTIGADGAFRLVSEAWTILSDSVKRSSYDYRRNVSGLPTVGAGGFDNYLNSPASHSRLDTFWTVCTSCHVQYEYLRKYVNKRLSCKNCRGVFTAVETGLAPMNGSYPYCPWSYAPENGFGSHGCGISYGPKATVYCPANSISGHHSGHGSEYVSNLSFQWSSSSGKPAGVLDPNLLPSHDTASNSNGKAKRRKANLKLHTASSIIPDSNGYIPLVEIPVPEGGRPPKKRKLDSGNSVGDTSEEISQKSASEATIAGVAGADGYGRNFCRTIPPSEISTRRNSSPPSFDARQLLITKARTEICKRLNEMKLASEIAAAKAEKMKKEFPELEKSRRAPKRAGLIGSGNQFDQKRTSSLSITVPDPDFHDFDKDRAEECFKPKQIWALYDEEDGMPRLYCLIRQVISVKPFKIHISYLGSKSDTEFGSVNWLDSGFTKSCGNFRAFNSDVVEHVNIFSHLLSREKAGRGGCVRIYPRSGDIWAVYRNWSPDWNRYTPDQIRHQYEMVEVIDDYSEEFGVSVTPLVKLDGFKTVYRRNTEKNAVRWIPRREMLQFSHQVPSCLLRGVSSILPDDFCWDLDPAATPEELLQKAAEEEENKARCNQPTADEQCELETDDPAQDKHSQIGRSIASLDSARQGSAQENSDVSENPARVPADHPESNNPVEAYEEPSRADNSGTNCFEHLRSVSEV